MQREIPTRRSKHEAWLSPHQQKVQAPGARNTTQQFSNAEQVSIPGNRGGMLMLTAMSHYHQGWSFWFIATILNAVLYHLKDSSGLVPEWHG